MAARILAESANLHQDFDTLAPDAQFMTRYGKLSAPRRLRSPRRAWALLTRDCEPHFGATV
jgi:hypothetical protein